MTWDLRQDVNLNDENHAGFLNLEGVPAGPMPDVLYVGLGSTSHTGIGNNNAENTGAVGEFWYSPIGQPYGCWVIYRDFGDVGYWTRTRTSAPTLSFQENADASTITLTFTGNLYSSPTVAGTFAVVPGATGGIARGQPWHINQRSYILHSGAVTGPSKEAAFQTRRPDLESGLFFSLCTKTRDSTAGLLYKCFPECSTNRAANNGGSAGERAETR